MNPLTNVKNLQKLNQRELALGLTNKKSWHDQYKDSAWIFVGGLPYDLTEGDIVCVFSQYGEVVNINLVRDKKTGKSKGFCFLCYENQKSTVLAVDNFNAIKLLGRTLRVDHVEEYKIPKEHGDEDEATLKLRAHGCAPQIPDSPEQPDDEEETFQVKVKAKKENKVKKEKKDKKKKKKKKAKSSSSDSDSHSETDDDVKVKVKKEKHVPGYDRALNPSREHSSTKRSHSSENSERKYAKCDEADKEYSRDNGGDRKRRQDESGRRGIDRDSSSEERYVEKKSKKDDRYSRDEDRFERSNRRDEGEDKRDKYRTDDRDKYRIDDRDKYSTDDRDKYRTDDRDKYRTDDRDKYRTDLGNKHRSDNRNKYRNDERYDEDRKRDSRR